MDTLEHVWIARKQYAYIHPEPSQRTRQRVADVGQPPGFYQGIYFGGDEKDSLTLHVSSN